MGTTLPQRTLAFRRKLPLLHHSDLETLRQVLKTRSLSVKLLLNRLSSQRPFLICLIIIVETV